MQNPWELVNNVTESRKYSRGDYDFSLYAKNKNILLSREELVKEWERDKTENVRIHFRLKEIRFSLSLQDSSSKYSQVFGWTLYPDHKRTHTQHSYLSFANYR